MLPLLSLGLSLALALLPSSSHAQQQQQPERVIIPLKYSRNTVKAPKQMLTINGPSTSGNVLRHLRGDKDKTAPADDELVAISPYAFFATLIFPGGQDIEVLVDTGSANLLVPSLNRVDLPSEFENVDLVKAKVQVLSCDDPKCRGFCGRTHRQPDAELEASCGPNGGTCMAKDHFRSLFNIEDSITLPEKVCLFQDLYFDGSEATGMDVTGSVSLGGLAADSVYGVIVNATQNFFEMEQGGGILGMSFADPDMECNAFSCFPPLFSDIVTQHNLDDIFAVCGSRTDPLMTLGGGDQRLYKGTLSYVPLRKPYNTYWVSTTGASVGEMKFDTKDLKPAVVDTGSTGLLLPYSMYSKMKTHFQSKYCHLPGICPVQGEKYTLWDNACLQVEKGEDAGFSGLPDIKINLGDSVTLSVSPSQYLGEQHADGKYYRCLQVTGVQEHEEMIILGETVLNSYYVEFDRVGRRLGFAPSVSNCTAALTKAN